MSFADREIRVTAGIHRGGLMLQAVKALQIIKCSMKSNFVWDAV